MTAPLPVRSAKLSMFGLSEGTMSEASTTSASSSLYERHRDLLRLTFCTLGICFCYWFYGFLQEKILSQTKLGATFILVVQTFVNIIVAIVWQRVEKSPQEDDQKIKSLKLNHVLLAGTSSFYVLAMTASNEALRYVSYPTAVLAKSCKLIPTMVMGWAIERRSYGIQQWCAAFLISFGIAIFNLSRIKQSSSSSNKEQDADEYYKGMVLLFLSLSMDGLLGACQGFVKRKDTKGRNERPPTAVETMLFINFYALFLMVPMAMASGQWQAGLEILRQDPSLVQAMIILNTVVAFGQIFIFLTITWYSSLTCTTITTTRKFFTILFSVIHFGHRFSPWQWVAVCMVFGGLYLSIAANNNKKKKPSTSPIPETKKED
eukprot:Nitzschia sp. Nitz4//scaffold16_size188269//42829//44328//NITZ4_001780-RA/size188269-snap-gene-0.140-mRNA-1//-1//CDS//3329538484//5369//frame0